MKKILIVSDSTRVGGIQKSLINMLDYIDYSKYNVDLFLFDDTNIEQINKNVKIIHSNMLLNIISTPSVKLKKTSIIKLFIRKLISMLCLVFGSNIVFKIIFMSINIKNEYDLAIAYSNNVNFRSLYFGFNKLVLEKVRAKEKKCWTHIDYSERQEDVQEKKEFEKMDEIVLVSKACKNNFDTLYPDLKNKTTVVYNIINNKKIKEMAKIEKANFNHNIFNILSIGRIEKNKNIEGQIHIASELKKTGLPFKWYVIGNGVDVEKIHQKILELDLSKEFILLGEKENVYPYIKDASLLVSTSLSESFGLTIAEALSLNVPIAALDYPALKEIVPKDCIFENTTDMCCAISKMIKNVEEYNKYRKKSIYLIKEEVIENQIYKVLGG